MRTTITRASTRERESRNVFIGGGAAWTPIDDLQTGKLVSFQVGLSHERTFAQEQNFLSLPNSGGSGVFLHQGVVWGANEYVQLFGLRSIPVSQEWKSIEDQQRFRLGAGAIFILGR